MTLGSMYTICGGEKVKADCDRFWGEGAKRQQ